MINTTGLPPLIADVFQDMARAPIDAARITYEGTLRAHDWSHEFSDDGGVYRRGRAELAALREQQSRIDPDFRVWDSIAPADYRRGAGRAAS